MFKHYLCYIFYVYLVGTNIEYIIHRFIMHNMNNFIGKAHITHHKHTSNKDMSLQNMDTKDYKEIMPNHNLILEIRDVIGGLFLCFFSGYIFNNLYFIKLNLFFLITVQVIWLLYVVFMWNSIHPYIHGKCGREFTYFSLSYDSTEFLAKNIGYIKWLINNHRKHHIYKGDKKGNYNIILPGADFIYNTYN